MNCPAGDSMEPIVGKRVNALPVELSWAEDLLWYDGPIISRFREPNGAPWLYVWCDLDENCNRWVVFREPEGVEPDSPEGLHAAMTGSDQLFVVDIDGRGEEIARWVVRSADFPDSYLPDIT